MLKTNEKLLKATCGIAVIYPCLVLAYLFTPGLLQGMGSESVVVLIVSYLYLCSFYFGVYSLIRWIFGRAIDRSTSGFFFGALAIAVIVAWPYVAMAAASFGWYEPHFNRGLTFGVSYLATPALLAYLALGIIGWRSRSSRTSGQLSASDL